MVWPTLFTIVVFVVLTVSGAEPDPIRVALLMTVLTATAWLVLRVLRTSVPSYDVERRVEAWPRGQDAGLSSMIHALENHLTSQTPNDGLRLRLVAATEPRLRRRHGVGLSDPASRDLLGEDLHDFLTGRRRRLKRGQLRRHVERIEGL